MPTVLVVDDSADERAALVAVLSERYRTLEAWDGAEALQLIRDHRPDVVVADLLMPQVDGFELIRQLRDDAELAAIPVVLCTGYRLRRDALGKLHGNNTVLIGKDCDPKMLLEAVDGQIAARQRRADQGARKTNG
jgi:CheY-like chemotaxis protein